MPAAWPTVTAERAGHRPVEFLALTHADGFEGFGERGEGGWVVEARVRG